VHELIAFVAGLLEPLRVSLFTVSGSPVSAGDILQFLIVLALSNCLGGVVERELQRLARAHGSFDAASVGTAARLMRWTILVLGGLLALATIGVPVTHLAIIVSALSVGIGFGMQTMVNNLVAGLILLSERSVRVGDFVELADGERGAVQAIKMRSTSILTPDGVYVLVPNATLIDGTVKNLTLDASGHRQRFQFQADANADAAFVAKVVTEAARAVPYTAPEDDAHAIEVGIAGFGNPGLNYELVVWVKIDALMQPYRLKSAYYAAINEACLSHRIAMPNPAYDLNVSSLVPMTLASPRSGGRTSGVADRGASGTAS
jgi:small-conductance mechanosensitive channel